MNRLTIYIMKKMTINFIVLFTLFFLLGAVIDIIVNLDEFGKIAAAISKDSGVFARVIAIFKVAVGFEGPRLFQVFCVFAWRHSNWGDGIYSSKYVTFKRICSNNGCWNQSS